MRVTQVQKSAYDAATAPLSYILTGQITSQRHLKVTRICIYPRIWFRWRQKMIGMMGRREKYKQTAESVYPVAPWSHYLPNFLLSARLLGNSGLLLLGLLVHSTCEYEEVRERASQEAVN